MRVLPFAPPFAKDVQHICVETADPVLKNTPKKEKILLEQYCAYYIDHAPDFCFLLYDDAAACVAGYVLCAPDYQTYFRVFCRENARKIARLSPVQGLQAALGAAAYRAFSRQYPAHLHIDLLEAYTRRGFGTQLMQALFEKLKAAGVPGVCLSVSAANTRAVAFYQKMGFSVLQSHPGGFFMGEKL